MAPDYYEPPEPDYPRLLREIADRASFSVEDFRRELERAKEEAKRTFRRMREAEVATARHGTPPLAPRQYHRPRRVGRACGSAHAVRLP